MAEDKQDNLHMKFSALNVDFSSSRLVPLYLKTLRMRVLKRGTLLKSDYLSTVVWSSVKMVADRHRHAAYHNKHWRRVS